MKRLPVVPRFVLATGIASSLCGCGVALGPSLSMTTNKGVVALPVRFNAQLYPTQYAGGPVVGIEEQVGPVLRGPCCTEWRGLAKVGYANLPRPFSSPVGEELLFLGGVGRGVDGDGSLTLSGLVGMETALPINLLKRSELWQADYYVGTQLQLVPNVMALLDVPTNRADSNVEISVGLMIRGYVFTAVLP